jgi:hypothetical protein
LWLCFRSLYHAFICLIWQYLLFRNLKVSVASRVQAIVSSSTALQLFNFKLLIFYHSTRIHWLCFHRVLCCTFQEIFFVSDSVFSNWVMWHIFIGEVLHVFGALFREYCNVVVNPLSTNIYIYIYTYIFVVVCGKPLCTYTKTGYAVVQLIKSLRYKPEDCEFDSRWSHWNFSLT